MKNHNKIFGILVTLVSVLIVSCAVSFVMLCVRGADPHLYKKDDDVGISSSAKLGETFDYGDGYIKRIIFTGDKTIASLCDKLSYIDKRQVWTGIDGTLALDYNLKTISIIHSDSENECSIALASEKYLPEYMIITVGIDNGVGHCTEDSFKEYYIALIDSIKHASPDTKIILQSIFPVSKDIEKEIPSISNKRISTANKWIAEICEETSVRYLDTSSVLTDSKGYLNSEYDSGNGMTLNEKGYEIVIEYIKTHGYK